jgi:hypothetical protein
MTDHKLHCDTNEIRIGRNDADITVMLSGKEQQVLLTLPPMNGSALRCVSVMDASGVARSMTVRTADHGADGLRTFPPVAILAYGTVVFRFAAGYWRSVSL